MGCVEQCHGLGVQSLASHCGDPGSRTGQSMWDLWWTKWHWDRLFSEFICFPLSISFHRRSPTYIIFSEGCLKNRSSGHWLLKVAVPWLRRLVASLSLRRPGFALVSVNVEFVVDEEALGQAFLRVFRVSPVNVFPSCFSILIYHLKDGQKVH
jgi:hypothetical protein